MALDPLSLSVAAIRAWLSTFTTEAWRKSPGVTDADMAAFSARMVPVVAASQMRVANLVAAKVARDHDIPRIPVDEELVTLGRGIDPVQVYERPIIATRSALADGKSYQDARNLGLLRARQLCLTDVQMAKVRQTDVSLEAAGQTFYRRVPQGPATCALCLIAATQPYKVGKLMPIHPGCDCGIEAIPAGTNLDHLLDTRALLEATHAKVKEFTEIEDRGGRAVDYRKLIITREHGEIGPLLAWNGEKFTGAKDIPGTADGHKPRPSASSAPKKSVREDQPKQAASNSGQEPPVKPPSGGQSVQGDGEDPRITESVRTHILDGDKNGGGHRATSTQPGKTLFPERWDDDTAMTAVSKTLSTPYTTSDDHQHLADPNFLNYYGHVDGVRMVVRMRKSDGGIDTAHPLDGEGVYRTDKKDGAKKKPLPFGSVRNVPLPHGSD